MSLKGLPNEVRALLITQLLFNIGFYLVVPFIAVELSENRAASGAMVGLILGLRTFSQQGMFFLGGGLADRFGAITILLIGVSIRVMGFLVVGITDSIAGMIIGVILIGFAAALFSPAVESLLATAGGRLQQQHITTRAQLFALDNAYSRIGALTGPLIGALLIPLGFDLVSYVGAVIFAGIFLLHLALLRRWPASQSEKTQQMAADGEAGADIVNPSMLQAWGRIIRNGPFVVFALLYSTYLLAYNQQYLALPVELRRATGSDNALSWYFAGAAVFVIGLQTTVTRWAESMPPIVALSGGFTMMSAGFAVVAAAAPVQLSGALAYLPSIAMMAIMHTGMMLAVPIAKDMVGNLAGNRDLGSAYGFLNSFGGLTVLIGSVAVGATLDWAETPSPQATVPWLTMTAMLAISAIGMARLKHRFATDSVRARQ